MNCIISYYNNYIEFHCITSYRTALCRIKSHCIVLYRIVSYHIISYMYCIISQLHRIIMDLHLHYMVKNWLCFSIPPNKSLQRSEDHKPVGAPAGPLLASPTNLCRGVKPTSLWELQLVPCHPPPTNICRGVKPTSLWELQLVPCHPPKQASAEE